MRRIFFDGFSLMDFLVEIYKDFTNMKLLTVVTIVFGIIIIILAGCLIRKQIEEYQLQQDPKLEELKQILEPMFLQENFSNKYLQEMDVPRNLLDKITLLRGDESYTINKSKIFLCLADPNKQEEYYSNNVLIYVLLHELAHVLCDEIGHGQKFHDIFNALLAEAHSMGIYDKNKPMVNNYCNMENKQH